jgi:branched-chain amino acid transport system ATP-binding protein
MWLLEASGLSIGFGGVQALDDVSFCVGEWEIVGIIGPNGAGKTTAFNCVSGFYRPDAGRIRYRGRDITDLAPHQRARLGMGRTFQNVGMVKSATALENLLTAQHLHAGYPVTAGLLGTAQAVEAERELLVQAEAVLEMLGLQAVRDRVVSSLPYGQLKLLELGCALATGPDLLLLDEPSSGLGPGEALELGDRLLELRRRLDLTLVVIEHHVPLVTAICDYVYVLDFGRVLAEGSPEHIQSHPDVVAAYLGAPA